MLCRRTVLVCLTILPLAAGSAMAADLGAGRLVTGGAAGASVDTALRGAPGENRTPLLTAGGFSVGVLADPIPSPSMLPLPFTGGHGTNLAVGGYVTYGLSETRLSSSLRKDGSGGTMADISAAYAGGLLGQDSIAALRLGASWTPPQTFSVNPLQPGAAGAFNDPYRGGSDINMSLSLMRRVTPSFTLSGVAEANRSTLGDGTLQTSPSAGFLLGAGMGYRF